jgi:hypothetical protein
MTLRIVSSLRMQGDHDDLERLARRARAGAPRNHADATVDLGG